MVLQSTAVKRSGEVVEERTLTKRRRTCSLEKSVALPSLPAQASPLAPRDEPTVPRVEQETSRTLPRPRLEGLPDDVLCKIFSNLSFKDIHSTLLTCRELHRLKEKRSMFRVLCQRRWPESSAPAGGGWRHRGLEGCPTRSRPNQLQRVGTSGGDAEGPLPRFLCYDRWYQHVLARDILEKRVFENEDPLNQILRVTNHKSKGLYEQEPWMLESVRWLVELHERYTLILGKDWDLRGPMTVSVEFSKAVLKLLERAACEKDRDTVLLATKAIGILCRDEQNRIEFGDLGGVKTVVGLLTKFLEDPLVLQCALWTLVHHSRPVGGVEGQSFDISKSTNYAININRMWEADCFKKCLEICEFHEDNPSVLAMVFWLIVNLSLPEHHKDVILSSITPIVGLAVRALERFPENWELCYRATFSLVNICCYSPVKTTFVKLDGFKLLNSVMSRWPRNLTLQRTALNVVKGFTTTQIDTTYTDDEETNQRAMFTMVCTAMRKYFILDRISESAELFEQTREAECPGTRNAGLMARWLHDLIAMNAH